MVKLLLISLLLLISHAIAGEGSIIVNEAPMFRKPDINSPVIQYMKKNERIYLHPVVTDKIYKYRVKVEDKHRKRVEQPDDPFLTPSEDLKNFTENSDFLLTKDGQGRDAWILREHVYVWYNDAREKKQVFRASDPTDYRLLEPLPENYPFNRVETLRANMHLSLGTPLNQNYPYSEKITAEAYGYQFEFNASMSKRLSRDPSNRLYGGGIFSMRLVESRYTLESRNASEQWVKLGFGGLLSYDAYRTDQHRLSLTWAALVNPFNQVAVAQKAQDNVVEIRNFRGWNFASRVGVQWQRVKITDHLDFSSGIWAEIESPLRMQAQTPTNRPEWWGANSLNSELNLSLAGFIGIQSFY
jgi:hypothetical protein